MRRFSQRNSLVTLSDINITPLLDLAFVLLIIFVITTPLLEQGLNLKLPAGGRPDQPLDKSDIRTVEVDLQGRYLFQGRMMAVSQIENELVGAFRGNPNLYVYIRADENAPFKYITELINRCIRNGISRYSFRTVPPERHP
ncbi:MAG: biopolymer transporter ExbD [Chloroflexi bacterium]|nr:biopolymer transporter ExbD [Chloroflexota bacterium]